MSDIDFIQKHPTIYKIDEKMTYQSGYEHGYQQGREDEIEEIEEKVSETTWYHICNGKLVEGANSQEDEPLYKYSDIKKIFEN